MDIRDTLKEVSLDYLKDTKIYNELKKIFAQIEKGQEVLCALSSGTEDGSLTLLKVGTLLSLSIVEKMWATDSYPKQFDAEDWKDIANKVADLGILADGQLYTEYIFTLYSNYIKLSVEVRKDILTDEKKEEILKLSDEIYELNIELEDGLIKEPDYVDKCLWISLEAMIKLLSAYNTRNMSVEYREFFQVIPDLAVQCARLSMYTKEQKLLEEYIKHQYAIDEELEKKYNNYISELEARVNQFDNLVDKAFDPRFKEMLLYSVRLAKHAGVEDNLILDSKNKIDKYFS